MARLALLFRLSLFNTSSPVQSRAGDFLLVI
nr:MAG TPA: hypothetical protein [Caudoviricetes sp.]